MTKNWLRLIYKKGIGLNQKRYLIEKLKSPEAVLGATTQEISQILRESHLPPGKLDAKPNSKQMDSRAVSLAVERDNAILTELGAGFIPFNHPDYPFCLNNIDMAPLGLFFMGDRQLLSTPQISIVGSRLATRSGKQIAHQFAGELAGKGLSITSGLATGIDASAHQGALDAGGSTVAVIASGIDQVYPKNNRDLHRQIVKQGLIVTEYPPCTAPKRHHFPQRNRIISGLSLGTLVVEAGIRSGSLITARLASEQGREVFAIPGSIHAPGSRGCHYLLRQGAALVENIHDILQELGIDKEENTGHVASRPLVLPALEPDLETIFKLIDYSPCSIEQLISLSGLTADQVSSILIRLELQGLVSESIGGYQRLPQAR